jgi:tetratricopeptide (TPR) repeat protein
MDTAAAVLDRHRSHFQRSEFQAAAALLDGWLLALPEHRDPGADLVRLERVRVSLASGAFLEASGGLRDLAGSAIGETPLWHALTGVLAGLLGDMARAEDATWEAAAAYRREGRMERVAAVFSNLAMFRIEEGRLDEAGWLVEHAMAVGPDPDQRSATLAIRGQVAVERGALDAGLACLDEAITGAEERGNAWACGQALSASVAVTSRLGHLDQAQDRLDRARRLLAPLPSPFPAATAEVWAGFLDVARGDRAAAEARLRSGWVPLREGLSCFDADLGGREAIRTLARALGQDPPRTQAVGRPLLRVGADGAWLQVGTAAPAAVRSRAARRILLALATAGPSTPPLAADRLIAAGWPGERILREAALNRLYVALSGLRALGLSSVLVTQREGYGLSASHVDVVSGGLPPGPAPRTP